MADEPRVLSYESPPVPPGTYTREWREYDRRGLVPGIIAMGTIFVPGVIADVLIRVTDSRGPAFVVFGLWFVLLGWTTWRAATRRCPRCGEVFDSKPGWHTPFATECLHCGLPKYAGR